MAYMQWETVVRYDCPSCRAALAWTPGVWRGWVLCPACGKPSRPPAPRLVLPTFQPSPAMPAELKPEPWNGSDAVAEDGRPRWSRELEEVRRKATADARWNTVRTAAGVALASSLFMMLVGYLDQNATVASCAAASALVMFLIWVRLGRR